MIVKTNRELKALYHELSADDVFIGQLSLKFLRHSMHIDMLERGIRCLPSPLSQILNSSKAAQAFILQRWMLPLTRVIRRRLDLVEAVNTFNRHDIEAVVTKDDRMHCGHGIRRWDNIETLYSFMSLAGSVYPFVVQPFRRKFTDIRVVIVGDDVEAYRRNNPVNFRANIASGGTGESVALDEKTEAFCRSAMQRGKFPYAHLDLMLLENNEIYLSEIALNGGIKGARIGRQELNRKKQALLEKMAVEIA